MLKLAVASSVLSTALGTVYYEDNFDGGLSKWEHSTWKGAGSMAEFEHTAGDWFVDEDADKGMATSKDMRFHAASSLLDSSFSNEGKDLVVQFSVAHKKHEYNCGGGYIKLLPSKVWISPASVVTPHTTSCLVRTCAATMLAAFTPF